MTEDKAVTAVFTEIILPPPKPMFTVNTTSLSHPANVVFSWTANGADIVHLYLNDEDQGEFNMTGTKTVFISQTTAARIDAMNGGGLTGSDVITITIGVGGTPFNYNLLLLLIIPIGLILFDRWLKKKPPFGKGEGKDYYTINIGGALQKMGKGKNAVATTKSKLGKASETIKKLFRRKPPKKPGGAEGYKLRIVD
jgi:hypothetical protein